MSKSISKVTQIHFNGQPQGYKMIKEILKYFYLNSLDLTGTTEKRVMDEALTAIYEIGLEVIGADETEAYHPKSQNRQMAMGANALRASQRKAWAKACGVDSE